MKNIYKIAYLALMLLSAINLKAAGAGGAGGDFAPSDHMLGGAGAGRPVLDPGIDINAVDADGKTPLIKAVTMERPDLVQVLLTAGARVNDAGGYGFTPLQIACSRSSSDRPYDQIINLLLTAGADVEAVGGKSRGKTPIMLAFPNRRTLETLLQAGANGKAVLFYTVSFLKPSPMIMFPQPEFGELFKLTELFLNAGTNPLECMREFFPTDHYVFLGGELDEEDNRYFIPPPSESEKMILKLLLSYTSWGRRRVALMANAAGVWLVD